MLVIPAGATFPSDDKTDEEKAKPEFGRAAGRALWSRFCGGNAYFNINTWGKLPLIRLYGKGKQPDQIYKDWFSGGGSVSNRGKRRAIERASGRTLGLTNQQIGGLANISYEVVSDMQKLSNVILAILAENHYKVECVSLDKATQSEKEYAKAELIVKARYTNPLARELGLTPLPVPFEPRDEAQVEMMGRLGMFKTEKEVALEMLAESGFRASKWKKQRSRFNTDAKDFHFRCAKIYNDPQTGQVKAKYIDTTKLVMIWNEDRPDDVVAIGHIEQKSIQSIYKQLIDSGFTHDQIKAMAQQYGPLYGNMEGMTELIWTRIDEVTQQWKWLDFQVDVLEFCYLSTTYEQHELWEKDGVKNYTKKEKPVPKKKQPKGTTYDDYKCNFWYEGNYIISGTAQDMIYGWRKMPNQMQKGLNPKCPYRFNKIEGTSPTERVMSLCDDFMFALTKLRAAVWAAPPPGYTIDVGSTANIEIGGRKYSVIDLFELRRQAGVKIIKTHYNAANQKLTTVALQDDPGGLQQGAEWMQLMANIQMQIMSTMGIPDAMAAQPDASGEKLPGAIEAEFMAGNNANWPLKESEREFDEDVAEALAHQARIDILYDPQIKKFYTELLGEKIVQTIVDMGDDTFDQMGFSMKALPTERKKDAIMMTAEKMAMMTTRSGNTLLKPSDVEHIRDLLGNDQIKEAQWAMADAEIRNEEKANAQTEKMAMMNFQGAQETATVTEQAKQQTILIAEQEKRKTMEAEYAYKERLELLKIKAKGIEEQEQISQEIMGELITGKNIKNQSNQKTTA